MTEQGPAIHVISVTSTVGGDTAEELEDTLNVLTTESIEVHNVDTGIVAKGLVLIVAENDSILVSGVSRTRRLRL